MPKTFQGDWETQLGQLCTGSETQLLPIHTQTAMVPCATATAYRSAATLVLASWQNDLARRHASNDMGCKAALGVTL